MSHLYLVFPYQLTNFSKIPHLVIVILRLQLKIAGIMNTKQNQ